jgi:hypothetical protein
MNYSSIASNISSKNDNFSVELNSLSSINFDGVWSGPAHDNLTSNLSDAVSNVKSQVEEVSKFAEVLNKVQEYKDKKERIISLKDAVRRCDPEHHQDAINKYNREINTLNSSVSDLKKQISSALSSFSSVKSDTDPVTYTLDKTYKSSATEANNCTVETINTETGVAYRGANTTLSIVPGSSSSGTKTRSYSYSNSGYSGGSTSGGSYSNTGANVSSGDVTRALSELEDTDGEFVNYYQYNYKESYGYGTTIASAGCGPTSMAMVLTKLTGKKVTPVDTANWSLRNGHRVKGNGTAWSFFGAIAPQYGVSCQQMGVSKSNIIDNLKAGKMLIMSMGPGHFTKGGHFIVLRGITEDGRIIVADPNSETRSHQTWDVNVFLREGKQIWAF